MKSRPILFSAPMVRALLNNSKTQTRRVFKLPRGHSWDELQGGQASGNIEADKWPGTWNVSEFRCPYGQPGDQLWVRETFQPTFAPDIERDDTDWETGKGYQLRYSATHDRVDWMDGDDNITRRCKPAIHMPRWASRITLEITGVRVERLQDISRGDAMNEGCPFQNMAQGDDPRKWYADLWESINGTGSWDLNPWVWVVEFKVVTA